MQNKMNNQNKKTCQIFTFTCNFLLCMKIVSQLIIRKCDIEAVLPIFGS